MPRTSAYLFTLHASEHDLETKAAIVAASPTEAASLWGGVYKPLVDSNRNDDGSGEYRRFYDGTCGTSSNPQSLGLCGVVTFVPALFREPTDHEYGMLGWDSGPVYVRVPGLLLHNSRPPKPMQLIMRRTFVHIPSTVFAMMDHERKLSTEPTHGVYGGEGRIGAPGALRARVW